MVRRDPSRHLEVVAALLCAAAALTVPLLPQHPLTSGASVVLPVLLLGAVALRRRLLWLTAGAALMAAGDVVFRGLWWAHGVPVVPSPADVAFVLGYVALARAAQLATGWTRLPAADPSARATTSQERRGATLDALIVVVGPTAVVAAVVHGPLTALGSPLQTAQALVAPVFDLLLLVLVVRASVAGALTRWQAAALQAAVVLLLLGNSGYLVLHGLAPQVLGPWLGAPFGLAFSLAALAVAAHRPAGAQRREPETAPAAPAGSAGQSRSSRPGGSRLLLALLPLSACLPAAGVVVQGAVGADVDWQVLGTGALLAAALSTARLHGALRVAAQQQRELERLVLVDELTGLPNRRACSALLDAATSAAAEPLALGLLDLDRFKAVNDAQGHAAGDALLRAAARAWRSALPPGAQLHRWGGEEFVVLLRGDVVRRAADVLDDLRRATPAPHTVSAGLVVQRGGEHDEALLARADALLYRAKDAGRDRVCSDADAGDAAVTQEEAAGTLAPTASS